MKEVDREESIKNGDNRERKSEDGIDREVRGEGGREEGVKTKLLERIQCR